MKQEFDGLKKTSLAASSRRDLSQLFLLIFILYLVYFYYALSKSG